MQITAVDTMITLAIIVACTLALMLIKERRCRRVVLKCPTCTWRKFVRTQRGDPRGTHTVVTVCPECANSKTWAVHCHPQVQFFTEHGLLINEYRVSSVDERWRYEVHA